MQLRKRVVSRTPQAVYIEQQYTTFYVVEKLECGHVLHVYPQSDLLTATRRDCKNCAAIAMGLPPKKQPQSIGKEAVPFPVSLP